MPRAPLLLLALASALWRCASDAGHASAPDVASGGSGGSVGDAGLDAEPDSAAETPGLPRPAYAYPSADPDVCFVPLSEKLELQARLEACPSHKVALEGGDYRTDGLGELVIRSGYELYGLPGMGENGVLPTSVPPIRIAGGTESAVLSTLRAEIEFEPSSTPTRHNLIRRIDYGSVRVPGGVRLESNLFLGLSFTHIDVDTSTGGWSRFNRFVYTRVQTNQVTHVSLIGDPAKQSYGNTILWLQSLGARASGVLIRDQGDLTLLDVGGEVWALGQDGVVSDDDKRAPLLRAETTPGSPSSRLWALNLNGGNILGWPTGLAEIGVDELIAVGLNQTGPLGSPRLVLGPDNRRFFAVHQSMGELVTGPHGANPWAAGDQESAQVLDASENRELGVLESHVESPTRTLWVNGAAAGGALPAAQQAKLRELLSPSDRLGEPWERPSFAPVPDPAGHDWNVGLADKLDPNGNPDSTSFIQGLIDGGSIGYLPAGIWYITAPLRVKRGRGLRGAGMGKTAIVAKSPDIDLIVGDDGISFPGTFQDGVDVAYATNVEIYLMDLTLQGGRNGIHHAKESAGDLAMYSSMLISHVAFRELTDSGIFIDRVYAWDTNLLDGLAFVGCKQAAIKQRVELHTGDAPGLAYMDKNFFYESQFIGSAIALDQAGGRASGGNVYASSLFRDNAVVAKQVAHSADLFANSDFVDNGGDETAPMFSNNGWIDLVSCRVEAGSATVLFRGLLDIEGSTFLAGDAPAAKLFADGGGTNAVYMTNSTLELPVGSALMQGVLANVAFAPNDPLFSAHTTLVGGGAVTELVSGKAQDPGPRLLFGSCL